MKAKCFFVGLFSLLMFCSCNHYDGTVVCHYAETGEGDFFVVHYALNPKYFANEEWCDTIGANKVFNLADWHTDLRSPAETYEYFYVMTLDGDTLCTMESMSDDMWTERKTVESFNGERQLSHTYFLHLDYLTHNYPWSE